MIPSDAKLVFKGKLFDVYQWEQEQFDGTYKTYERLRRKPSVTILPITEDGKFLICEEEQPSRGKFLSIPGGQVDEGDASPEIAAARELLEETGYMGTLKLWMQTHPYGNKIEWDVHNYIARGCRRIAEQKLDSGERIRPFLVDFEKFIEIVLYDENFRNVEVTLAVMDAMRKTRGLDELKKFLIG